MTITYQTAFELAPASRSSLALDGAGGLVTQQVPTSAGSQLWQLVQQGSLYQIVNLATGQCLTTWGSAGAQLFLWFCTPMPQNEWQLPANFQRDDARLAEMLQDYLGQAGFRVTARR